MIVIFNHLHFKAFTCARLRASHHSSIIDQDVNLKSKQRKEKIDSGQLSDFMMIV